jgi:hypothetical protein
MKFSLNTEQQQPDADLGKSLREVRERGREREGGRRGEGAAGHLRGTIGIHWQAAAPCSLFAWHSSQPVFAFPG